MNTLEDFEAWCRGEGRGGQDAGIHWSALNAVERFKRFRHRVVRENDEYACTCGLRWGIGEEDPHK